MLKSFKSFEGTAYILGQDRCVKYDSGILTIDIPDICLPDLFARLASDDALSSVAKAEQVLEQKVEPKAATGVSPSDVQETSEQHKLEVVLEKPKKTNGASAVAVEPQEETKTFEDYCGEDEYEDEDEDGDDEDDGAVSAVPQKRGPGRPPKFGPKPPPAPKRPVGRPRTRHLGFEADKSGIQVQDKPSEDTTDESWRVVPEEILALWKGTKDFPEFVQTKYVAKGFTREWYDVVVTARREELEAAAEIRERNKPARIEELVQRVGHPVVGFTGTTCPTCGASQIWCVDGVTCSNGHTFEAPNTPQEPKPSSRYNLEALRACKTLREIIAHLKTCGYTNGHEILELCMKLHDHVPVLQKIAKIEDRLPRALEVAEAEERARASLSQQL